ncbi:MAG: alpha-L-fucosidase [Akkermansia sp.]
MKSALLATIALCTAMPVATAETDQEHNDRVKWWRDAKFGMFIHYGLYSGLGGEVDGKKYEGCVEWIQMMSGLDSDSYAKKALPLFNPKKGCAKAWVKLAKESGVKYITLTSKHHEGFALFDSKACDFNSVKTKGVDIIKEYSEACRANGIKAGYYYSLLDWQHPDYDGKWSQERGVSYPKGNLTTHTFGNHDKYKKFLLKQINELITNYGPVDLIWWDFSTPNFEGDEAWGASDLLKLVRSKQPKVVMNNRFYYSPTVKEMGAMKAVSRDKGDFTTPEHYIPQKGIPGDWEACMSLNGTWGYSASNTNWKTDTELLRQLTDTVSRGGNLLLNLGPKPDGSIPEESARLFKEMGKWLKVNGDAIYGTTQSPFTQTFPWGVVTQKGNNLYAILYTMPEQKSIQLPCTFVLTPKVSALADGTKIPTKQSKEGISLDLSHLKVMPHATVVKIVGKCNLLQ